MDKIKLNTEYSFVLGAYWMIYGIAGSFASVFMLAKGFDNMSIGVTLAAANLLAVLFQPFIADSMDKAKGMRLLDAAAGFTAVMMLTGTGMFASARWILMAALTIILAVHAVMQPVLNTLAFRLSESGIPVSYGIGRAGGSLGFSLIVAVLGSLVERRGEMAVPVCTEAACALLILLLFITKKSFVRLYKKAGAAAQTGKNDNGAAAPAERERINIREFIRRNKAFFIMNLGIAGLFFSNAVLTNYMAQIAGEVNGTTEEVGRILSLMALAEMPTMMLFDLIRKRFRSSTLLKVAALGFTAKIAVCWLAGSVTLLFAAQIFQLVAFALIMPAMVYYVDEIMSPGEAVKGQALFTMMITVSTIAASLAGGWILDASGARTLTFIATAVTAAGAAVVILCVDRVKSHR